MTRSPLPILWTCVGLVLSAGSGLTGCSEGSLEPGGGAGDTASDSLQDPLLATGGTIGGNGVSDGTGASGTNDTGGGAATGGGDNTGGMATGGGDNTGGTATGGGDNTGGADNTGGTGGTMSTGGADSTGGMDGGDMCDLSWPKARIEAEDEVLKLVNAARAKGATCGGKTMAPAPALTMDSSLRCAARLHSQDMADRDFFSHATWDAEANTCSKDGECNTGYLCRSRFPQGSPKRCGKGPGLRVKEVGGPSGAGWENIAAGNSTAKATVDQWLSSAGHCENMMRANLKTIGIGYYTGGSYGHYWTQAFND